MADLVGGNGRRTLSQALAGVSFGDWLRIGTLLVTLGLAWARLEMRMAVTEAHLEAIESSLQRYDVEEHEWRKEREERDHEEREEIESEIERLRETFEMTHHK